MAEPQIIQQTQTSIPEYARPYVEQLLGATAGNVFRYEPELDASGKPLIDASGKPVYKKDAAGMPIIAGFQPTMQYQGDRVAQFSPLQQQAFDAAQRLGVSQDVKDAAGIAALAAKNARDIKYTPSEIQAFTTSAARLGGSPKAAAASAAAAKLGAAPTATAGQATAGRVGAVQGVSSRDITAPTMQGARSTFDPRRDLEQYQMGAAERVGTDSFLAPGTAGAYMSPYVEQVLARQMREADRQAGIASTQRGAQFAQAGAFGGGRQAIENAEAARNLEMLKGDIQAKGLQSAFEQAQRQFNTEEQAALQAQLANQQAGLTVGSQNLGAQLGVQQLGVQGVLQMALANLSNEQQAAVNNQAAQLQASGMNQQAALQAALANNQTAAQREQTNAQLQQAASIQNAQLQTQASLANQAMAGQYGLTGAQLQQQANLQNAQLQTQAALANQSMAGQYGIAGAQMQQQAGLANLQAAMQAQQLKEQASQFGAGLQLQGQQTALSGAGTLSNIGNQAFNQQQAALGTQAQLGGQQQQQAQNILNQQYQDFQAAQNKPQQQLAFMSDVLRGVPLSQATSTQNVPPPSTLSTVAGLGAIAKGVGMFAKGGRVGSRTSGLADLLIAQIH